MTPNKYFTSIALGFKEVREEKTDSQRGRLDVLAKAIKTNDAILLTLWLKDFSSDEGGSCLGCVQMGFKSLVCPVQANELALTS